MLKIEHLRQEYKKLSLNESESSDNPFELFEQWFEQALHSETLEPNAMILSTADENGAPDSRAVLLKIFDERGFVFFTNYNSTKAKQISSNPHVSANFLWLELERQVRIRGRCEKITLAESAAYFMKRSRASRLGAWISDQSSVISSRQAMMMQFEKMKAKFKSADIPLPDFWGGYRIVVESMEFWQGRENRLHDRLLYTKSENNWRRSRLAP